MPVLDTEVLFALNPRDRKHNAALKVLSEIRKKSKEILVPDTVIFEFQIILKSIVKEPLTIKAAILALRRAIEINGGKEVRTMDSDLIMRQCEIEERYGLTYFDSLIAASVLKLDGEIISDDKAFSRIPGIHRIPLL